jgi:branched-chain amino acid transport system permease protein
VTEFAITAATLTAFFVVLAAGLNLQWGITGLANFGPVGFFALGAYVTGMGMMPPIEQGFVEIDTVLFSWGLAWPVAVVIALAVTAVVAFLLGQALIRANIEPLYMAIITLAFAEILFLLLITQKWLANGFNGVRGLEQPFIEAVGFENYDLFFLAVVAVAAVAVVLLVRFLHRSPYGRVLRGIREDPAAVEAFGHDIRWFRLSSFTLGCVILALAGALWAPFVTVVEPSAFGTEQTFLIWSVLIIGGAGNAWGPLVGALAVVGVIQQGTRFIPASGALADLIPSLRGVLIGILFILFLRFRPDGLVPDRLRAILPGGRKP